MNERLRDLHHLSYEKRRHKTGLQKIYRGMGLMATRIDIEHHRELHHTLRNPPLPPTGVVLQAGVDSLRQMERNGVNDPLRVMSSLIDAYGSLSLDAPTESDAVIAMTHEQFLIDQYPHVQAGRPRYQRTA